MQAIESEKFKIPIDKPRAEFEIHLNDPLNNRILFSSAFGTGKTYFLGKFFEEESVYHCFHLFPINYSVSTNEDIFELIKYDLLFRLLAAPVEFDKVAFSKWFTLESYIHFKPVEFFKSLFGLANKLGQIVPIEVGTKLIDAYEEVSTNYKAFAKNVQIDEKAEAIAYIKAQLKERGSIYEYDHITALISGLLIQLKAQGKKTVLLIDDLDRIDPEHIFRLLNVFAAHLDINKGENKFGFDKVVFVCDENNVRNIFSAKYGANVDYTGYIDKFYSQRVFEYDNAEGIKNYLGKLLNSITIKNEDDPGDFVKHTYSFKTRNSFSSSVLYILGNLAATRVLTIRTLERLYRTHYTVDRQHRSYSFIEEGGYNSEYDFIVLVNFLVYVFKGYTNLIFELEKASLANPSIYMGDLSSGMSDAIVRRTLLGNIVSVLDIENHHFKGINRSDYRGQEFLYKGHDIVVEYSLFYNSRADSYGTTSAGFNAYVNKAYSSSGAVPLSNVNLFKLLSAAIAKLQSYRE